MIDLSGKKIVIAGASSGIGRQTAVTLSRVGAKVILIARREEKLQEVINELEGNGHSYYAADLSVLDAIEGLFKQIYDENGKIDGMVYSAGVTTDVPLMQLKPEKVISTFDINVFGFIECTRQICRKGRFNEGMRIVGISSTAADVGGKAHVAYAASKGAMDSAVKNIAFEVADKGICVNAVAPGWVDTEMYKDYTKRTPKTQLAIEVRQYLGLMKAEDVARVVAFLLSPSAHYITGVVLPVDGGMTSS